MYVHFSTPILKDYKMYVKSGLISPNKKLEVWILASRFPSQPSIIKSSLTYSHTPSLWNPMCTYTFRLRFSDYKMYVKSGLISPNKKLWVWNLASRMYTTLETNWCILSRIQCSLAKGTPKSCTYGVVWDCMLKWDTPMCRLGDYRSDSTQTFLGNRSDSVNLSCVF